jgi:CheY-like chemotaxis protein
VTGEESISPMAQGKFQILLIDDSEADAKVFELALREAAPRAKIYWVATAQEGLDYLHKEKRFQDVGPVDLVVCDLNIPGMSGFDFLAEVKQRSAPNFTPLVVYRASSSQRDIQLSYSLGASSYIVKAMTLETVVQQLKTLVHYWLEVVSLPNSLVLD